MSNCDEAEFAKTAEYNPAVGMVIFIKASCPNETMRSRIGVIVEGPLEGVNGEVLFNVDNGKEIELVEGGYVNPIGDVYTPHKQRLRDALEN